MGNWLLMSQSDSRRRLFISLYLAHLVVPLLIFLDVVLAWVFPTGLAAFNAPPKFWYSFGTTGQFAIVVSGMWLIAAVTALILTTQFRLFDVKRLYGPLVAMYSFLIILGVLEGGLQIVSLGGSQPALWPPGEEALVEPDTTLLPGIQGAGAFTGNDVGLRGPDYPKSDDVFKIITVGGSTTESLYLDDTEEWAHLIMDNLNLNQDNVDVWIGNAGQSGRNTIDHLELLRVLPVLSESDLLVFLVGINDLQPSLSLEGASTQELLEMNAANFRLQILNGGRRLRPPRPYFKRSELFFFLKRSSAGIIDEIVPASILTRLGVGPGVYLRERREQRASTREVAMPDLDLGLLEYRQRLLLLAGECRSRQLRCLFVTQPSMWRDDLPAYERSLLSFGWVRGVDKPIGYVSVSDLAIAMDMYNQELLDLCFEEALECYDLAADVPKDTAAFYDDIHFNENGARIVADSLTEYLLQTPPFSKLAP